MAKALYTQAAAILLTAPIDEAQVASCLSGFEIAEAIGQDGDDVGMLVLNDQDVEGGQAIIIVSDQAWPDDPGTLEETPELFVAWTLGQYGPLTYPDALLRASEHSWRWDEGREIAAGHKAHIRILYCYGSETDISDDIDPIAELHFVTRIVSRLLELPTALAAFNPAGEVLINAEDLREGMNESWKHNLVPVDMWTNVRLFRATDSWTLMDTIGNDQFDLPDLEVLFENESFDPSDVEAFMRNVVLCMLMDSVEVDDGDTSDGPGDQEWRASLCLDGLNDPPRPTIRWYPVASEPPVDLLQTDAAPLDEKDDVETPTPDEDDSDEL